jgi:hypothetical protein
MRGGTKWLGASAVGKHREGGRSKSNHWLARNKDQTDNLIPKRLS